ncbi:SPRY domain-containing protein 3 [Elysia marginata]|uniref:SPRY domain-containing protein 3 n=1 Tax=Elysia marginata TaxID=1093978 RepID=A0AAV4JMJ9_9GAST|nr:SPRY domain-containing protein 3 [Elysia marginata]
MFHYNALYDNSGIVSYVFNYKSSGSIGLVTFQQAITRSHNTFSIKILKQPDNAIVTMGLGTEDYPLNRQPGWEKGSIAFHGDNGKFYLEAGSGSFHGGGKPTPWKTGDEITAVVEDFGEAETIQPEDTVVVNFYHNQKHKPDTAGHVKAFSQSFRMLLGQLPGLLLVNRFDKRELFSTFISKTPFNKHLNFFEMRVKNLGGNMHAAIGFAPEDYAVNNMVGWLAGSIGYHADNG